MHRRVLLGGLLAAALAAAMPAVAQAPAPWTTLRETVPLPAVVETGRVKVNDVQLYYAIYGRGRPVVLLHPGLGHSDYWANQIGPLSQAYQVIVIDLRGHGRSTGSDRPLSYELMADDVMQVLRKLHIEKPAIVGWGDGAVVGLELAMRHPGRVSELIAFGLTYDLSGQQPGVDKAPTFVSYVGKTAADYERLSPQPARFDAAFRQLEALWSTAPKYTAEDLAKIRTPTTIMAAEYDEWVRLDHMQQAARLIPDARIVTLRKSSHFAPWQTPKAFNDALRMALDY